MDLISLKSVFILLTLGFLFFYWIFNFIILYHLARFGVGTLPKKLAAVFLLGSVALFCAFFMILPNVDFNKINETLISLYNLK